MTPIAWRSDVELHVAHVDTVERDAARRSRRRSAGTSEVSVVLPEPVWPISAIVFPGATSRSMSSSTGRPSHVLEADALEAEVAAARRQLDRAGPVGDLLRLVHHLEDPLARRGRALRLADPHAERAQRHDEHRRGRG